MIPQAWKDAGGHCMTESPIKSVEGGICMDLLIQPKAKRTAVVGIQAGRLKIAVQAPPESGKANAAVIRLIAELMGVAKSKCSIRRGLTSRQKTVFVPGIAPDFALRQFNLG